MNSSCSFFWTIHLLQAKKWGKTHYNSILISGYGLFCMFWHQAGLKHQERKAELQDEHLGNYSCCPTVQHCKNQPGICYSTIRLPDSFKSRAWAARRAARATQSARSRSAPQGQYSTARMRGGEHFPLSLWGFWDGLLTGLSPSPGTALQGILQCLTHAVSALVQSHWVDSFTSPRGLFMKKDLKPSSFQRIF